MQSISEPARPFAIGLPAVLKHVSDVLTDARSHQFARNPAARSRCAFALNLCTKLRIRLRRYELFLVRAAWIDSTALR